MEQPRERSWFRRNWVWLLPVGCLLPFLVVGGCVTLIVVGVFGTLKYSDAYNLSLAAVRADEHVQEALGEPIEPSFLVSGNINLSTNGGNADVSYDIHGPKGTATVNAVAVKEGGSWNFRAIKVVTSGGKRIDVIKNQQESELLDQAI
jgi:Cytochrome oxidase complex assembly protein 1